MVYIAIAMVTRQMSTGRKGAHIREPTKERNHKRAHDICAHRQMSAEQMGVDIRAADKRAQLVQAITI